MVTSGSSITLVGLEDLTDIKSVKLQTSSNYHVWSPDGNALLLHSSGNVVVQKVDGTGATERYTIATTSVGYPETAWSRDSQVVSVVTDNRELRLLPAYQDLPTSTVLTYQAIELQWSPTRNEFLLLNGYPGVNQLYVGLIDGSLRQVAEAAEPITEFSWSSDGDYLQYKTSGGRFVVSRGANGTDPGASIPTTTYLTWLPSGHQFVTYGSAPLQLYDAANVAAPTDLTTENVVAVTSSPSGDYMMWNAGGTGALLDRSTQAVLPLSGNVYTTNAAWTADESRLVYSNSSASYLVYLDEAPPVEVGLVSPGTSVHISPIAKTAFYAVGTSAYLRDVSGNPPGTSLPIHSVGMFGSLGAIGWSPDGTRVLFTEKNGSSTTVQAAKVEGLAVSSAVTAYNGSGTYEWQPR